MTKDAPAKLPDLSPAACAAALAERFPALFGNEGPPRPIKLRIQADIQQRAPGVFSRKSLSVFLHRHTTSTAYLRALAAAPARFDLDGAPAGEIAEEHRAAAREEVERRRAMVQARRQAEARARRVKTGPASPPQGAPEAQALGAARPSAPSASPEGDASPGPPRPPRPPRQPRPGRPDRGPRPGAAGREDRPPRREERLQRSAGSPPRAAQPDQRPRAPAGPEDAARRDRLALLRAWESSPLTKANFCALKRMAEADFDAVIEQARRERAG